MGLGPDAATAVEAKAASRAARMRRTIVFFIFDELLLEGKFLIWGKPLRRSGGLKRGYGLANVGGGDFLGNLRI